MGFKDTKWAYALELPATEKVVLAAICHRTNDRTHITLVGQETIARMVGHKRRAVLDAMKSLEARGLITRRRRYVNGFRSSDELTVVPTHVHEMHLSEGAPYVHLTTTSGAPDAQQEELRSSDQSVVNQSSRENKPRTRSTAGARIADDWQPSVAVRDALTARFPGVRLDNQLERFVDYWLGVPGERGAKADWDATFRNWIRRAADSPQPHSSGATDPTEKWGPGNEWMEFDR